MACCGIWIRRGTFLAVLSLFPVVGSPIEAQTPASDSKQTGTLPANPAAPLAHVTPAGQPSAPRTAAPSALPSQAAPKPAPDSHVNDYIPCLLDASQLSQLRGQPPPKYLTKLGAQDFEQAVATSIDLLVANKTINADVGNALKAKLTASDVFGSDASQSVDKARDATKSILSQQEKNSLSDSNKKVAADAIVGAAIEAVNKGFEAPPDVACSMSLLTYTETSDIFGLRVAKDYVAVQVVVRNLNQQDEYLLHDVQLAVDTDPCGSFSQFDGGRDRLLVRAVALRNQFTDPRNWAVRILEGVGTVASTAVGFASRDYSLGLGVFNGVSPAVRAIFPDYTVDQLNRLSDLAFTSSGQTRTVVSKNGVVMFVTFFPVRPLEQAWWIKDAGATPSSSGPHSASNSPACVKERNAMAAHFNEQLPDKTADSQGQSNSGSNDNGKASAGNAQFSKQAKEIFSPKPLAYRYWQPNALLEFRRHTFVAIAGVHIAQEDDLKPVLDELTCPETNGVLNLNQNAGGTETAAGPATTNGNAVSPKPSDPSSGTGTATATPFPCQAKGKNLDKVVKLRLRDAKESLDTTVADGTMKINTGDSTQGTVMFSFKDMNELTGDTYNVFWMDKTNVENSTGQVVKLAVQSPTPVLAASPLVLTLATLTDSTLQLTGANLDKVTGVQVISGGNPFATLGVSKSGPTMLTVDYKKATLSKLVPGVYELVPVVDGKAVSSGSNTTLTLK
jgi:hypothetical protein